MRFKRTEEIWPAPQTYRTAIIDGELSATITCPTCGIRGALHSTHEIDAKGHVTPSVACADPCTFHAYIFLEGWDPVPSNPSPRKEETDDGEET